MQQPCQLQAHPRTTLYFRAQSLSALRMSRGGFATNMSIRAWIADASSERIMALMGPTAAGVMENLLAPRPINAIASSGRPAISPQILTVTPAALQASMTRLRNRRIEGLSQS